MPGVLTAQESRLAAVRRTTAKLAPEGVGERPMTDGQEWTDHWYLECLDRGQLLTVLPPSNLALRRAVPPIGPF